MDVDNQQTIQATANNNPGNGVSSDNSHSVRSDVVDAKARMFGGAGALKPDQSKAPATPAKEQSSGTEEGTSAESTSAKKEIPQPEGNAHKPARNPKDVRSISKLTAQKYQLKSEVDRLNAEIAELRKLQGNAPKAEDFADPQDFQQAKIEHNLEVKQASRTLDAQSKAIQQKQAEEWTSRCQELTKDFSKFSNDYSQNIDWISQNEPELLEMAASSTIGPRILEQAFNELFANKEMYANWNARSPQGKRDVLARLESNLMREFNSTAPADQHSVQEPTQQAKSSAPAPITPERKSGLGTAGEPATIKAQKEAAKRRMFG